MFKVLDTVCQPTRATKYSAMVDLYAREDVVIGAGETKIVPLGVKIDTNEVYDEKWTDIIGYEGKYRVSNYGNVYSYGGNNQANHHNGKMMKAIKHSTGYYCVNLSKNGKKEQFLIHRLVASHFLNLKEDMQVNHINGIKTDNFLDNLEVVTIQENRQHAMDNGLQINVNRKFNKEQVEEIKEMYQDGFSQDVIASMFQTTQATVWKIVNNISYQVWDNIITEKRIWKKSGCLNPEDFKSKFFLELHPRSSLRAKGLIIGVGVIDLDFPNEIGLIVHNSQLIILEQTEDETEAWIKNGRESFIIKKGDKVAQCTLKEHKGYLMGIESDVERSGGFGSTGV